MKRPRRFLFDECIGEPIMAEVHEKVYSKCKFEHICTKYHSGVQDEDWIPKLSHDECEYVVITADNGKNSIRSKKLPELCREYKITHVVLSPNLSKLPSSEKQAVLIQLWKHIESVHDADPGSRFQLRYVSSKGKGGADRLTVSLVPIDYAELDRKNAERAAQKAKHAVTLKRKQS